MYEFVNFWDLLKVVLKNYKIYQMTQNLQFITLKLADLGAHILCPSITPNVCDNHFSNLVQWTLTKL